MLQGKSGFRSWSLLQSHVGTACTNSFVARLPTGCLGHHGASIGISFHSVQMKFWRPVEYIVQTDMLDQAAEEPAVQAIPLPVRKPVRAILCFTKTSFNVWLQAGQWMLLISEKNSVDPVWAKAETDLSSPACTSECHDLGRSHGLIIGRKIPQRNWTRSMGYQCCLVYLDKQVTTVSLYKVVSESS